MIYTSLLKPLALPHYLCGGVPGKTILDNVFMHLGAPVLITLDVRSFFRSITNRQVYNVWRNVLNCSPRIAATLTRLTTFERHLPQGAPTSSLLANLVLYSSDAAIRSACAAHQVAYSTWVDDLAFSGRSPRVVINAAVACLRVAGLSVLPARPSKPSPSTRHPAVDRGDRRQTWPVPCTRQIFACRPRQGKPDTPEYNKRIICRARVAAEIPAGGDAPSPRADRPLRSNAWVPGFSSSRSTRVRPFRILPFEC